MHWLWKKRTILYLSWLIALTLLSGCNQTSNGTNTHSAGDDIKGGQDVSPNAGSEGPSAPAPVALQLDYPDDVDLAAFRKDNEWISRTEYVSVNPEYLDEQLVRVGMGIDMSDPNAPVRRNGSNPVMGGLSKSARPDWEPYTINESFTLREATSASEEGDILSAYFKGSYNFASVDAAYDQAVKEHSQSKSIYALLDSDGLTRDLEDAIGGQAPRWKPNLVPIFEGTEVDPLVYRKQFLLDYGSHYVSSVRYGYRIAIRGKMKTTDISKQKNIRAAFNATFMSGEAAGGVDSQHKETLSGSEVELTFVATSGGLYEGDQPRPGVLTKLEDILDTLQKLRDGRLVVHAAPVSMSLRTYWNLLPPEFKYARALLYNSGESPVPDGFHGVPRGTVIAWHPREPYRIADDSSDKFLLRVPQGWALCDGTNGTPNLKDRFVFGTTDINSLGMIGGEKNHSHQASSANNTNKQAKKSGIGKKHDLATAGHAHTVNVEEGGSYPPFVRLVYLMKL